MKKIVWQMADGSIAVTIPLATQLEGESETIYLDRVAAACKPDGATLLAYVEASELPLDRDYRDAWKWNSGTSVVDHDLTKAADIHLDRIRTERNAKLAELDIAYMKALEAGDTVTQASIAAQKQTLRDIPQTLAPQLAACTTIAEIKAITAKG